MKEHAIVSDELSKKAHKDIASLIFIYNNKRLPCHVPAGIAF